MGGKEKDLAAQRARANEVADLTDRRDRELLGAVATGDEQAFAELFSRYGAAANGLARRVIGDAGLAEEVLQEVFLSVWRKAASYDQARGSVRSWLLAQVHHRAVDVIRREEASRRRADTAAQPDPDAGVDEVVEESWLAWRRDQVRGALATLPDEQRRVVEMAYFGGMTQAQVAERAGIPLGTVKSRTLTALKTMRGMLRSAEQ